MAKHKITVVLMQDPESGEYSAFLPLFPMCATGGSTPEEALAAAKESLELHLECSEKDEVWFLENAYSANVVVSEIEVEIPVQPLGPQSG